MGAWRVEFSVSAGRDLSVLGKELRRRIIETLEWFAENFDILVPIPLGGPWKGFFKLRVGGWRVIYQIHVAQRTLAVRYIDHRSKIYKRR